MRILFCNIAYMKYYKGIIRAIDEPRYGGEYVLRENDAAENITLCLLKHKMATLVSATLCVRIVAV